MAIIKESVPAFPASSETRAADYTEKLKAFIDTKVKIAVQKDGELTQLSRSIFKENYGIDVPYKDADERLLVEVDPDGETGFLYARNKDICKLVAAGAVDMAIIGTDRLAEDGAEELVEIVETFENRALWPLVLTTPLVSGITSFEEIKAIATKYPTITRRFLAGINAHEIDVIEIAGGAEIYPYLGYNGKKIDAIVDMSVTGASLEAHSLTAWGPPIAEVFPVLIRRKIIEQEVESA